MITERNENNMGDVNDYINRIIDYRLPQVYAYGLIVRVFFFPIRTRFHRGSLEGKYKIQKGRVNKIEREIIGMISSDIGGEMMFF